MEYQKLLKDDIRPSPRKLKEIAWAGKVISSNKTRIHRQAEQQQQSPLPPLSPFPPQQS